MTSFWRVIKFGWINFKRNSGFSVATIFVMVMTIFFITSLFFLRETSQVLITTLQEKMDMYVYFDEDLSGEEILGIKDELSLLPEIKEIKYVSKEEALLNFTQKHSQDEAIIQSLEELGKNPLLAALNIQAEKASQYAAIAGFLDQSAYKEIISQIDYQQKKPVIDRLFSITGSINQAGIILIGLLTIIVVLISFNTVRLAIHSFKDEIETMRLVGASNWFIRGPFLVQGAIVGIIAALATSLIFLFGLYFLSPSLKLLFFGFDIFNYFISNLSTILLIQFGTAIGLGIFSNWLAVRRYLRV